MTNIQATSSNGKNPQSFDEARGEPAPHAPRGSASAARGDAKRSGEGHDERRDVGPLGEEVRNLVADVESVLKSSANLTAEQLAQVRARLEVQFAQAKEAAQNASAAFREKAGQAASVTERYVQDHPWKAVGIAAAAGLALGALLSACTRSAR